MTRPAPLAHARATPPAYRPAMFDPMSTEQISNTICEFLERQPLVSMTDEIPRFEGSGLYALYYRGTSVDLYRPLANLQIPVYAGQALSSSSATGRQVQGKHPLHGRLRKHRVSIVESGLPIEEFRFRALLLPDVHADLGENALRVRYQPVWNSELTGFGSNEQGASTRQSNRTKWDTVHEGRARTYGAQTHDKPTLVAKAGAHIAAQVSWYERMPWQHPAGETLLDPA